MQVLTSFISVLSEERIGRAICGTGPNKGCLADTNLDDDHNTTNVVDVVWTVTGMLRRGYYVPRWLEIRTQAVGTSYYFIM